MLDASQNLVRKSITETLQKILQNFDSGKKCKDRLGEGNDKLFSYCTQQTENNPT